MIVCWFYFCIWKGKGAKIAHAIVVAALTTLICSFGLLWLATYQPCPTIVGFLDEPNCPPHGCIPNFKAFHCLTNTYNDFVGLFFNISDDIIGNIFSKGMNGEFAFSSLLIFYDNLFTCIINIWNNNAFRSTCLGNFMWGNLQTHHEHGNKNNIWVEFNGWIQFSFRSCFIS